MAGSVRNLKIPTTFWMRRKRPAEALAKAGFLVTKNLKQITYNWKQKLVKILKKMKMVEEIL